MEKKKVIIRITGVLILVFSICYVPENNLLARGDFSDLTFSGTQQTKPKSVQTGSKTAQKSAQTGSKTVQKSAQTGTKTVQKSSQTVSKTTQTKSKTVQGAKKPVQTKSKPKTGTQASKPASGTKVKEAGIIVIGTQTWAEANLNVSKFRNGDTIPEAKTNEEWKAAGEAGKPAWCYYNNDPKNGPKYGKLYNWYAVNDPRGLAPEGWSVPAEADWAKLIYYLGGPASAGDKMKSTTGWNEDYNGHNQSGFNGFPGGYRDDIGSFYKIGNVATWWSSSESKANKAIDFYLSRTSSADRSISQKQLGESIRCIRK